MLGVRDAAPALAIPVLYQGLICRGFANRSDIPLGAFQRGDDGVDSSAFEGAEIAFPTGLYPQILWQVGSLF